MSRFIECCEGLLINADFISHVKRGVKRHDDCTIVLVNGNSFKAPCYVYGDIAGEEYIKQIVPCDGKYETVYMDTTGENGGKPWVYDCDYLAVCADGQIRALECNGEYFDFAESSDNYMGFRQKEKAGE